MKKTVRDSMRYAAARRKWSPLARADLACILRTWRDEKHGVKRYWSPRRDGSIVAWRPCGPAWYPEVVTIAD